MIEARRRCRRRSPAPPSSAPSRAAGRRNRARSASAWPRHRRRTAAAARPPSRRTTGKTAPSTSSSGASRVHGTRIDRQAGALRRETRFSVFEKPRSWRTRFIRSAESSRSWIVKAGSRPICGAYSRSSRAPIAWNVPDQVERVGHDAPRSGPSTSAAMRSTRRFISAAARRENVSSRMRRGSAPADDQMRDAMRQRVGLARAGAGDDQQRGRRAIRPAMLDGAALFRVELGEIGSCHRPEEKPEKPISSALASTSSVPVSQSIFAQIGYRAGKRSVAIGPARPNPGNTPLVVDSAS